MKSFKTSILIVSFFSANLFSNCVDINLLKDLAIKYNGEFSKMDSELSQQILVIENLKNEIINLDNNSKNELENLKNLNKDSALLDENNKFLLEQHNQLQSIINSIDSQ